MSDNIKVVVKVRPLIAREIENKLSFQWRVKNNTLYQLDASGKESGLQFTFDKVYDEKTKTADVYKDVAKPIVEAAIAGFNGTIFAYGQTSSGKTYTMSGTENSPGIIELAVLNLFAEIKSIPDRDFLVRVSYIEIYNETLKDLLNGENDKIRVRETLNGVKVDATEKFTSSPEEVMEIMRETIESREHIEGEEIAGSVNVSILNLVDLAGSERSGQTGATGKAFKEGTHINKSLSVLALVIKQLSEDPHKHANYRDSKLTRILQNSLGGNAKTSIICAVTPAAIEETISTLQFANRAKAIKNKPEVNAVATDATKLQDLTKQLSRLQSELATKNLIEQDNRNLMKQISSLQKMILNGFGQRSVDIGGCRRKTWCAPRRVTISTLHVVDEDKEISVPKFCTPTLKYNPMSLPNARDFQPIQRPTQLEPVSEETAMITPPPKDKKVNFSDEIIDLDSDEEENTSNTSRCSPYHKCYNASKTPPCVLRKNAKAAEKNLKDIVELTNREKMYNPDVVEYMEKLEKSAATIASLEENLKKLSDVSLEKDSEFEVLKYKITQTENEIKTVSTAKEALEVLCKEYNTKITDLEVSYETLKTKAKLREEELLCLLNEQTNTKKTKDYGKSLSRTLDKEFDFMDLSKDISLVSDHDSSIDTSNTGETPVPLQELVTDMNAQINYKNEVIAHLESNLLQQKDTIESLESTCRELREQIFRSDTTLEHNVEENSMLKTSIEILNSTIKTQKQNLETANSDMQSYNNLIQELQSKLIEKNSSADLNISDNLLESMLAHEETFIANNENMKNIIQSFKIALETRTKEIVNLKSELHSKTSQLQAKEEQTNKLVEEVQKSKEQLDENMNIINKLIQENENLVKSKDDLSEKLIIADKQKHETEKTNIELQKQNEGYHCQLRDFNEHHDTLLQNLNDFKNNLTILHKEKDELCGLQNVILLKDNLISDLKSEVHSKDNLITSLNSKHTELQEEVTMKDNQISNLKNELMAKDNLISSLSSKQAESQDTLCNFKSAAFKLQRVLSVLTGDVCVESEIIDDSVAIFSTMYEQLTVAEVTAKEVISQKESAVVNNSKLEHEIEKLRDKVETLTQDKNKIQNDKSILNQEIIQLKEDAELLQNELGQLNNEKSNLTTEVRVLNERIRDQESDLLSRIEEILQQDLRSKKEIENLLANTNQTRFDELLLSKEEEIIKLKNNASKRESMLDENYIELQKISKTLDETVKNRNQILDNIYTVAANLMDKLEIQNDVSLNSADVYRNILQLLDKVEDKISSLKCQTSTNDIYAKELEETKQKLDQLQKLSKEIMENLSRTENENKLLIAELNETKIVNHKLSNDLLKGDEILKNVHVELRNKLELIESLELKCSKWTNDFAALEESMKMQIMELQAANIELQSQCSQKDSNETYSLGQVSSVSENHQLTGRKSLTNILVEQGNSSPQSLLTLCCNTIIDTINPSESCLKSETPSSSTVNFEAISVETQTHPCDCDKLLAEKEIALEENMDLKTKLDFLQLVNVNLLKEQEEIRKELKLLVEPAHELQKKISNHRTNLSTLTATTYAENKLLKSQVKVLQHHNNRFHSVCQRDLPAFKKSLQELSLILKSTSMATRLETSIKRYSLPEVLDRNSSASNFRDESTLDSDLLMLDTNVTLASADNTLLVQDQTGLDGTQVFLDTEINTDLIPTIDPNILHTQLQILSIENQKLTEKFISLKEENCKLHKKIEDGTDSVKSDIQKIDAQSSPIKQNRSPVIETLEDNIQSSGELCKNCGSKNMLATDKEVTEQIKLLTEELLEVKLQNADFEKKCYDLNADIIDNDKLVIKMNTLEKNYNLKLFEIDQLTKKLNEFSKLQEENDLLSTQIMESIDEADDLKKELDTLKEANKVLTDKCTEFEQLVKCTNVTTTCSKCSNNASTSPVSMHSALNRSRSDSESTSSFNKLSTLQNELLASREDCKTISKDVATIKSHFDLGNMAMSHSMELDDSMGEHNIFTFPKELSTVSPKTRKLKEADIPKDRCLDTYDLDRIDCFSYYFEKTGAETNLNQETKIIDVMKMLYNSLIAKHGNEIENLVNKLKDFEESRNELHEKIDMITCEYSKICEEIKDKDNHINSIANSFNKIRLNLAYLDKEITGSDINKNAVLVTMFKDKLLNILDSEFELTSVGTFESLIDNVMSKHQTDLLEIMTRYSELQGNMELVTSELSKVTNNLSQIKCQLSDKEKEYNLLKSQKEKMHEISNAVTLDIVQKDQELNEIISKGCEKLLKSKVVTPSEIDLSLPAYKNISVLIEKLIHQSQQMDLVSQEKHNLMIDVTKSKTMLEENEEEMEKLKSEIEKLHELCKNATSELVIKNEALETLSSLHEQLKEVYDKKTEENNTNVNIVESLTQELVIMKENMYQNEIRHEKQENNDSEMKIKIAELVESINRLEHENKKLKSVNEMIKNESEQNTLQLAKADDTIKHNKTEIDKMTAEILSLNLSLKESLSVIESLKLEAKSLLEENDDLMKQFEEVNKLCSQLKLNIKTHEKTAEIQCKTIARLKQEKENSMTPGKIKNKQIEELTQKCEALRKECVTLNTDLDKTKRESSELMEEKEFLERRVTELEGQLESTQKSRVSLGSIGDNSRRRRQSLLDSKRMFGEQELDHKKMETFFATAAKPEEMFMEVDDNSNRSTPVRSRRSGSFQSKNEESDRDEGGSRPGSAMARRRRRQSLHDMHRVTQPTQDHLNTLDEVNKLDSGDTSEVSQLKERLEFYQQELEELRERYREVDAECETCAEYLRERDEQCMQLTNHNKALQHQITKLNEKLQNASMNRQKDPKRSFANASVNTDEDWANLHSVVVDRMSFDREVEKNKSLQRCVDELRFKNGELKATLVKMQKSAERAARNKADIQSGSFQSKNEESDRDEGGSRPGSAMARRRRRQSLHDMHRVTQPTQDHLNTLDEVNKLDSGDTSEVSQLKERLEFYQQELEELRERYREVDAECETCAEYLRERDEQCMQLTNHNKALQHQITKLNEKLQNANWANLHSVVVDRMSFDREVEKNKSLQRCVDELRFKNGELKATLVKCRRVRNALPVTRLIYKATKLELQSCKRELEECKERCKELDEECETCGAYLRERDEQLCRLKEAKDALEAKLEALVEKETGSKAMSVRKKRQSMHDQNRNSAVQCADASTETTEDILSYQVERDNDSKLQRSEMQQLKMAMENLSQQKTALELQLRAMTSAVPMMSPVYVATGSAIVQNQHLTDIMKENQKLKKMNAKLITICKKRGKPLGESNRENDDPAEMG
ncbi:hypothetical protein MSG28_001421 [Choristoneura fumiferana]|uniref:Uncharacterized protein n=1 Tax=Choristoneura fumiferana TaxID=7141 RepID=A0ACC0KUX5_CHOFU|nr:hypothetical protein MSG28_001421 [Choristoneura fumiferana]